MARHVRSPVVALRRSSKASKQSGSAQACSPGKAEQLTLRETTLLAEEEADWRRARRRRALRVRG